MTLQTYYKISNHWYLDAPEYLEEGGDEDALECIGAFHDFLESVAEGASTVVFHMDTVPFGEADQFRLVGSSGGGTGGYYHVSRFGGRNLDFELWFDTLIYFRNHPLPQAIYIKLISPS